MIHVPCAAPQIGLNSPPGGDNEWRLEVELVTVPSSKHVSDVRISDGLSILLRPNCTHDMSTG